MESVVAEPLLSLRGVAKSYWRGLHQLSVLVEATLDVLPGEFVAVWGRRGAGKTTLLKIAAGLEEPDSGQVLFQGRDITTLTETERTALRHERIGWVRRARPRSGLRIINYVALPLMAQHGRHEALRRAHETLVRVGVNDCAEQHWEHISDGERALVSIAHGVARSPRLLLVDDPTASLGMRERETVTELLRTLAVERDMGVLMSAPDMPTMMSSHQIRALSGGRLLAPPDDGGDGDRVIHFPASRRSA